MNLFKSILLLMTFFIVTSCTKESDVVDNTVVNKQECIPYITTSFSAANLATFEFDSTTMIVGHRQEDNCLILNTRFSGGCEDHLLRLLIDVDSQSSINLNPEFAALLSHNNTDLCEGFVSFDVYVDISNLEEVGTDEVTLTISNYNQPISLLF